MGWIGLDGCGQTNDSLYTCARILLTPSLHTPYPTLGLTAGLKQVLGGVNEAEKKAAASTIIKDEDVRANEEGEGPEEQGGEDPVAVLARLHQVTTHSAV